MIAKAGEGLARFWKGQETSPWEDPWEIQEAANAYHEKIYLANCAIQGASNALWKATSRLAALEEAEKENA